MIFRFEGAIAATAATTATNGASTQSKAGDTLATSGDKTPAIEICRHLSPSCRQAQIEHSCGLSPLSPLSQGSTCKIEVLSWRWLLHFIDREPMETRVIPEATHAEIFKLNPTAVAAEPIGDREGMVPFDLEAWLERAGICEYDGHMSRADAERLAWTEDDARWEAANSSD